MTLIEMVVINNDLVQAEEMADLFEMVQDRLPCKLWDGIELLGKIEVRHDFNIMLHGKEYPAHEYTNIMRKMKMFKDALNLNGPFLGITYDPLVRIYTSISHSGIKRKTEILRDYVHEDIVVYSAFGASPSKNSDAALHTLGHLGNLRHHIEPIDIMYNKLLSNSEKNSLMINSKKYFCDSCKQKLLFYSEKSI